MRARTELRRLKHLPPILDLDEDGNPQFNFELEGRRWSSDEDEPVVQLGDFPVDIDD